MLAVRNIYVANGAGKVKWGDKIACILQVIELHPLISMSKHNGEPAMRLYVYAQSPMSRKAMFANALMDLNVEERSIDIFQGEHKKEDFLARNPNAKVPMLALDD